MKLKKSQLKELIRQAIVEDIMDKEIENPKTGNKIKVRTALQLPDEHPANKKAKDMVAKTPTKDDEPMDATPADKDEPKGPTKNPFSKESPAFEPKQKQMDKELLIKKSDDIVKQFQGGEYESLEDLVMYASPAEIQEVMEKILEKIPDGGQNFNAANEYWYDLNDHEMGMGSPADYDEDQLKDAREGLFQALTTPKEEKGKKKKGFFSKLNPFSKKEVKESKMKRFTVKEVRMWMKKLEENRYKKVYNSDARRVAWMVNNEGVELSEMPKSMSKKWTKAQYGRERYLANEFIKSKSEQLSETKFYAFFNKKKHTIDGNSLYDAKQKAILKLKVPKSKVGMLSVVNAKEHERGSFRFEQKLRESIREIIKEQLNLNEFVGAGKPIPSNKAKQLFVPENEMIRFSRVFKKLIQKGFVYVGDQTKEKKKINKHYTITVDKKMYDNLLDILMNKRFKVKT